MNIEPKLPSGFRDYLPAEAKAREKILDIVKGRFELAGFAPLETPGLEREDVLTGGDPDFKKQIFKAGLPGSKENLALRFDLTVPLARAVASHQNEIIKPFKRYQIGEVWRGERPQAGRFREFLQCDADIVGSASVLADAEMIDLIYRVMQALGFKRFTIRVNDRKILNKLPAFAGFGSSKLPAVLRAMDKLDKIGLSGVKNELAAAAGAGLAKSQAEAMVRFLEAASADKDIFTLLSGAEEGGKELADLLGAIKALGVPEKNFRVDFSLARGLGYYTGPVFETVLSDAPQFGSVMSGGRYDGLVGRFGGKDVPATGVSVGLDRLFAAMKELKMIGNEGAAGVLILNFEPAATKTCLALLSAVRGADIPAEVYLGTEKTLKGQLAYAVKRDYAAVIIVGGEELERKTAQVKDLRRRAQKTVPLAAVPDAVRDARRK